MNTFVSICRSLHPLLFMNKTQSVIENDETTTVKLTEAKVFQMLSKHCEKKRQFVFSVNICDGQYVKFNDICCI